MESQGDSPVVSKNVIPAPIFIGLNSSWNPSCPDIKRSSGSEKVREDESA